MDLEQIFEQIENSFLSEDLALVSSYQTLATLASKHPLFQKLASLLEEGVAPLEQRIRFLQMRGEHDGVLALYLDLLYYRDPAAGRERALSLTKYPGFWTKRLARAILHAQGENSSSR